MLQWLSKINKCFSKRERAVDLNIKSKFLKKKARLLLPRKTSQSTSQEKGACSHQKVAHLTRVSMRASLLMLRAARCNKLLNQQLLHLQLRTQQLSRHRASQKFQLSVASINESYSLLARDQMPRSQEQALCQLVLMVALELILIAQ